MTTDKIKWVSPTGYTVVHEAANGTITYKFPDKPHPQPACEYKRTTTNVGLKPIADNAMIDAPAMEGTPA